MKQILSPQRLLCLRLAKHLPLSLLIAFICLTAQTISAQTDSTEDNCLLIVPQRSVPQESVPQQSAPAKAKRVASRLEQESISSIIRNTNLVYHVRLATLIDPSYLKQYWFPEYSDDLRGHKDAIVKAVHQYWDELETELNEYFRGPVGIEFEVIRNDKLILFDYSDIHAKIKNTTDLMANRHYIDSLLGGREKNLYDVGITIAKLPDSRTGASQLGSAIGGNKGASIAIRSIKTVAHELGHSFGADHTHQKSDSNNTEPGYGESIMSYGSPRDFFSLASIREMRAYLYQWSYYTDKDRKHFVKLGTDPDCAPYAYQAEGVTPKLDRDRIKSSYTVTVGTDFQFYLPVTNWVKGAMYSVHPYDVSHNNPDNSNVLKPAYKETSDSCVMFKPEYIDPNSANSESNMIEAYSDASREGTYTFLAGVRNNSLYDSKEIKLNIVKGKPFAISSITKKGSDTAPTYFMPGQECEIKWEPCTELYGEDSKVRILLSDDDGITYKYVVAQDVPNTGSCTFIMPYVTIGTGNYHGWALLENGGRFKVEVEGEAAFAVYPPADYYFVSQGNAISNGWTFSPTGQRYAFKCKNADEKLPEVCVNVKSIQEIPKATELLAYRAKKASTTYPSTYEDKVMDSYVRRTYTADCNGTKYYYVQNFLLPNKLTDQEKLRIKTDAIKDLANDLNANVGKMAYPKESLSQTIAFKEAYSKVFENNWLKASATADDVTTLKETLVALSEISDDDIVMPKENTYYLLRFYVNPYGRAKYYYLKETVDGQFITADSTEATRWLCTLKDGKYHFTNSEGREAFDDRAPEGVVRNMQFDNFSNVGFARTLVRGYSWGSYTLLNNQRYGCMMSANGVFSILRGPSNEEMLPEQRTNCNNTIVSTDFQLVPLDGNSTTSVISIKDSQNSGSQDNRKNLPGVYSLDGSWISNKTEGLPAGIYIVNGKKVIIKY